MKKLIFTLLLLPSISFAGTITTYFSPLGTVTYSSGTAAAVIPIAVISSTSVNGLTTGAINTTGATLIVAAVSYNSGATITSFTDSKGSGWSKLTAQDGGSDGANVLFYSSNPVVGSGHTFTASGSSLFGQVAVIAFSGTPGTPFDSQNGSAGTGVTTKQPGNVTPSQDNELIVSALSTQNAGTESINSSFSTPIQQSWDASHYGIAESYIINGTGTSGVAVNPTWTHSGSAGMMATTIAVFK